MTLNGAPYYGRQENEVRVKYRIWKYGEKEKLFGEM